MSDYINRDELLRKCQELGNFERIWELVEADKEGRCAVLPCKAGDKLYDVVEYRNSGEMEIVERTVQSIEFFEENYYVKMYRRKSCKATNGVLTHRVDSWVKGTDINKTVFLSKEAAEVALKEREQHE